MMVNRASSGIAETFDFSASKVAAQSDKAFDEMMSRSARDMEQATTQKRNENRDKNDNNNNGIQVGYATSNSQVDSREANSRSTVGGRRAENSISTQRGDNSYGKDNTEGLSSWEKSKELKNRATRCTPGMGSAIEAKARVSTRIDAKGIAFAGRNAGLRADGMPTMTDDQGNLRVLNAKNPEMSIADLIKNEGVDDEKIANFAHDLAKQNDKHKSAPTSTSESYIRQSETIKSDATEHLGKSAKDKISAADFFNKNAETETKTETDRAVADASKAANQHNGKKLHGTATSPNQEAVKVEQNQEAETESQKSKLIFNSKGDKDAATISKLTGNTAKAGLSANQSAQTVNTPQLGVDASQFAANLNSGDRVQAAKHLSDLLGARMNFMLNNNKPTVNIHLNPRQLGDIQIKLVANGENSVARIHADKESVGKVLELAAPQLAQQLQKAGFQVETVAVDYGEMSFDQQDKQAQEDAEENPFTELLGQSFENGDDNNQQVRTGKASISIHDGDLDVVA